MGKLVVTTNMSLDGVVQDPDGKEGSRHGGWFERFGGADLADWTLLESEEAMAAEALVLGRHSDEWFAARWLGREGAWADRLNAMPKFVVSTTLKQASWSNATVLAGEIAPQIARLKQDATGEILVYASYRLIRTLVDLDLVDEFRLVVFPAILGAGERLFGDARRVTPLRLLGARVLGTGLTFLEYEVVR